MFRPSLPTLLLGLLFALPALAGCIEAPAAEPVGRGTDAGSLLVLPDVITGIEAAANVAFGGGNEVAFRGDFVYVSSGSGMHVVDVSDPFDPLLVATAPCTGKHLQVVQTATALLVTVASQGNDNCDGASSSGGIRLIDVTVPAEPVVLSQVPLRFGSHTHTAYGDTGILYNSAYDLTNPYEHHRAEIVDVSDPLAPKLVGEFMFPMTSVSHGCHDILAEPEFDRAICAGITETQIWDTSDPLKPVLKDTLRNPLINIHHSAATAREGKLLILGDEFGGALAPACNPSGVGPTGALWFYEIDGYSFGRELGHLPPPAGQQARVCTAHNFNLFQSYAHNSLNGQIQPA